MRAYVVRRLLLIIPTLVILSILVFLSARFIPGDVIDQMVATDNSLFGLDREALLHELGLDVPVHVQYGRWLEGIVLRGTLGDSLLGKWSVEEKIVGRFPVTLELGFLALVIGLVLGVPIGIWSAIRQDTTVDYAGRPVAILGLATPNFWLGIMVMTYPGRAQVHGAGAVAGAVARPVPDPDRLQPQHVRRRRPRPARPAPAGRRRPSRHPPRPRAANPVRPPPLASVSTRGRSRR